MRFIKISDARHAVSVTRDDGTTGRIELDTRRFLHHDLVHLAVEGKLGLDGGFWGNVAAGSSLSGDAPEGDQVRLAEWLAGRCRP